MTRGTPICSSARLGAVAVLVSIAVCALAGPAVADPDPKRKVVVLEYRAGSSALPGISARVLGIMAKQTSLHVLGPDQTRATYGDTLDQAVVKCAGDAECIARIGQKAGAVEVLLVGVSELGDVILTMQRIDVARQSVSARIADSLATGTIPTDSQIDTYLQRVLPPGDFLQFGVIDIVANLTGAAVTVGGQPRGVTPIPSLKLHAPATYDIRVDKAGYIPFSTKVALPPDGVVKVEAQLSRQGERTKWYQQWYVLAGAGLLVAGAAGTTIYFVTRDDPTDSVPVSGIIR
ncbi:MAG: PEGA domain-containing protein [Kofleriaceae bacterium]